MAPEVAEFADAAPADGGGLQEEPQYMSDALKGVSLHGCGCLEDGQARGLAACVKEERKTVNDANSQSQVKHVGGLVSAFGEPDVDLVLEDGSRLPAHSCLLVAFSGTFRDLFLRPRGRRRRVKDRARSARGVFTSKQQSEGAFADAEPPAALLAGAEKTPAAGAAGEEDQLIRSRDVQPLLAGVRDGGSNERPHASASTSAAAVAAAAFAATAIAEQTAWQPSVIIDWGSQRGEVCVRFFGPGTVAAVVQHLYTGKPPSSVHVDGLGRLLVAAVSLRMPRLMRQVEHLLSAGFSQKSNTRAAQHAEAARLLRAARVLRAKDLEDRCTLYLQENGVFPAVMKVR